MNIQPQKIGLITYHSAYNFGSVLQSYATIKILERIGFKVEVIDYRTYSQTFWYTKDFSFKKNYKENILNYGFFINRRKRKKRAQKFEEFISSFFNLTETRFSCYEEIKNYDFNYDILVAGSDQIWNLKCGEFRFEPKEAIYPYFLKFGNPKRKIAYASSFGSTNLNEIKNYKNYLLEFDYLSTREPITKELIEKVIEHKIDLVCDPTWLLSKNEWLALPGIYKPKTDKKYILIYTLGWRRKIWDSWISKIKILASKLDLEIYCVSPLFYNHSKSVTMLQDAGPIDFLSYLSNASLVITTTFHGTIFSMNFEIPFYSCNVSPGSRQAQMLSLCNLEDRIINNPSDLLKIENINCEFTESSKTISDFRNRSIDYLKKSLEF